MYKWIILSVFVLLNLISYCMYAFDKKHAENHERRTPVKRLLAFTVLGPIGAHLAVLLTGHKKNIVCFQVAIPVITIIESILASIVLFAIKNTMAKLISGGVLVVLMIIAAIIVGNRNSWGQKDITPHAAGEKGRVRHRANISPFICMLMITPFTAMMLYLCKAPYFTRFVWWHVFFWLVVAVLTFRTFVTFFIYRLIAEFLVAVIVGGIMHHYLPSIFKNAAWVLQPVLRVLMSIVISIISFLLLEFVLSDSKRQYSKLKSRTDHSKDQ